jgi:hypothetical protein
MRLLTPRVISEAVSIEWGLPGMIRACAFQLLNLRPQSLEDTETDEEFHTGRGKIGPFLKVHLIA